MQPAPTSQGRKDPDLTTLRPLYDKLTAALRLAARGRRDQALRDIDLLIRAQPDFGPAYDAYADLARKAGRLEVAAARFRNHTTQSPTDPRGWYALGRVHAEAGRWQPALEATMKAIDLGCLYSGCYTTAAAGFLELKQPKEGEAWLRDRAEGIAPAVAARPTELRPRLAALASLGLGDVLDDVSGRNPDAEAALARARDALPAGQGREQALRMIGTIYLKTGRADLAGAPFEEALAIHTALGDTRLEGHLHLSLATLARLKRDFRQAAEGYDRALRLVRDVDDTRLTALVLGNQAVLARSSGDPRGALPLHEQALSLYRSIGHRRGECAELLGLGNTHVALNESQKALEAYRQAAEVAREAGDRVTEANALGNLGLVLQDQGEVREAVRVTGQAVDLQRRVGNPVNLGNTLNTLANAWFQLADYGRQRALLEEALEIQRTIGDRAGEAMVLNNLALNRWNQGDPGQALELSGQALTASREAGYREAEAQALGHLALFHEGLGETRRALDLYLEALRVNRETGYKPGEAVILGNLAGPYRTLGRRDDARQSLEACRTLHHELGNVSHEGIATADLAQLALEAGDEKKGLELFAEAEALLRRAGNRRSEVLANVQQADALAGRGAWDRALPLYEAAIPALQALGDRPKQLYAQQRLAGALARAGRRDEAKQQIDQALELAARFQETLADPALASSWFQTIADGLALKVRLEVAALPGDPAPAIDERRLRETFLLAERARSESYLAALQAARVDLTAGASPELLGAVRDARGNLNQARAFLDAPTPGPAEDRAITSYLSARLEPWSDPRRRMGDAMPDTARELDGYRQALQAGTLEPAIRARLRRELYAVREEALAEAERAVRESTPALRALAAPRLASLEEVRSALGEKTVLIAWLQGELELFAWILTREEARLVVRPGGPALDQRIDAYRRMLQSPATLLTEVAAEARALSEHLLAPAAELLEKGGELVIVADGSLGLLPFEALVRPGAARQPAWLGVDHTIVYAPSATAWWAGRQAGPPSIDGPLLAVGDARYPDDRCESGGVALRSGASEGDSLLSRPLPRLCHSREELELIRESRRKVRTSREDRYLMGKEADEAGLRAQPLERFALLHFSAHGVAVEDYPQRSAVVLSPPNGAGAPDGYLELREIAGLRLRAGLVVLSACETAVGRQRRGEGIESLARGFLLAGARQVVASQWQVADRTTTEFMGRFYRGLSRGPAEKALREARRAFVTGEVGGKAGRQGGRYAHPYFWAPFVLITGGTATEETR